MIDRFKKISPSELGHALEFGFMNNDIVPLNKEKCMYVVGTAITARIPATDSTMVYKAMTYSKPGDVLVIDMQGEAPRLLGRNDHPDSKTFRFSGCRCGRTEYRFRRNQSQRIPPCSLKGSPI